MISSWWVGHTIVNIDKYVGMKEFGFGGGGGGGDLGGYLAKKKKTKIATKIGVSTWERSGAWKVTHKQEEVRSKNVMCGKNLIRIVTTG